MMSRPVLSLIVNAAPAKVNASGLQRSLAPSRRRIDPAALKARLAGNWSLFLMRAFPDDVAGGAAFFGVTEQCFRYWIDGDHCRPSGHHVAMAAFCFGADLIDLLADGAVLPPAPVLCAA